MYGGLDCGVEKIMYAMFFYAVDDTYLYTE